MTTSFSIVTFNRDTKSWAQYNVLTGNAAFDNNFSYGNNDCSCIIQDNNGYLWIKTDNTSGLGGHPAHMFIATWDSGNNTWYLSANLQLVGTNNIYPIKQGPSGNILTFTHSTLQRFYRNTSNGAIIQYANVTYPGNAQDSDFIPGHDPITGTAYMLLTNTGNTFFNNNLSAMLYKCGDSDSSFSNITPWNDNSITWGYGGHHMIYTDHSSNSIIFLADFYDPNNIPAGDLPARTICVDTSNNTVRWFINTFTTGGESHMASNDGDVTIPNLSNSGNVWYTYTDKNTGYGQTTLKLHLGNGVFYDVQAVDNTAVYNDNTASYRSDGFTFWTFNEGGKANTYFPASNGVRTGLLVFTMN